MERPPRPPPTPVPLFIAICCCAQRCSRATGGGCPAAAHPPPPSNFSAANKEWSLEEAESLQGAGLEALGGGAFGVGVCHSPPVRPRSLYLTPPPRGPLSSLWFPHQSLSMVLPSLWFPSSLWLVLPPLYGPCAVPAPDPRAAPHSLGAGQSALRAHPIGRAGTNRRPRRVRQRAAGEAGRTRSGGGAGGGCGARWWWAALPRRRRTAPRGRTSP